MKTTTIALNLTLLAALLIPTVSMAKVDDFNSMITANGKAQQQLHQDLHGQVHEARIAQHKLDTEYKGEGDFLQAVNAPTDKGFMTFRKETVQYRASEEKQMERLADEFKSLDTQF